MLLRLGEALRCVPVLECSPVTECSPVPEWELNSPLNSPLSSLEEPRLGGFAIDAYRWPGRAALARYDLVAVEESGRWSPRGASPGRKMLLRYFDEAGRPVADVAHAAGERFPPASELGAATSAPLLANVMRAGRRVAASEPPRVTRERAAASVRALHERHRSLTRAARYPVAVSDALDATRS